MTTRRANPYPSRRRRPPPTRRRRGFTLVEMLIVLAIILVLIALLLPAITQANKKAARTRMALDLQAIVNALEAYRQDHGDVPRTSPDGTIPNYTSSPKAPNGRLTEGYAGAQILCRALLGPGNQMADGAGTGEYGRDPAPGFRPRAAIPDPDTGDPQGKIYGPYISPDKFGIGGTGGTVDPNFAVLVDSKGKPILYFPGSPSARISGTGGAYVTKYNYGATPRPMFNVGDNDLAFTPETNFTTTERQTRSRQKLQLILGDTNMNGIIDGSEMPAYKGQYLLLSAGPDELYGPGPHGDATQPPQPISTRNPCDDVANFERSPNQ